MSATRLLSSALFRNGLGTNKKSGKQTGSLATIALISILIGAAVGVGTWAFYTFGKGLGISLESFAILILVGLSILTLIMTFFQMHTSLFKCRDYDFLASLPVKNFSIVIAKLLNVFLTNFLIDILGVIVLTIMYVIFTNNWLGFACILIGGLFCDAIPLLITTIIGALIALITAKSKHGDTIAIILYVVFFVAVMAAMAILMAYQNVFTSMKYVLPYFIWLEDAMVSGNGLGLLYFVLVNIAAILVVIVFVSLLYTPLNQIHAKRADGTYKLGSAKNESAKHVFFKKECNLVLKNSTFLLSSYVSPLIFLVLTVIFFGFLNKGFLGQPEEGMKYLGSGAVITGLFIASLTTTTYASFSMEGNNFKLLAAYPITSRDIIRAKTKAGFIPLFILYLIVGIVLTLLAMIITSFSYNWLDYLGTFCFTGLLPAIAAGMGTLIGTLCGLKWVRFDFQDPNDVLKKSRALAMFMLFSFIVNVVAIIGFVLTKGLFLASFPDFGLWLVFGILIAYYVICYFVVSLLIHFKGEKLFKDALEK